MKILFTLSCLLSSSILFCQVYQFKPQWEKGEVKQLIITQVEKEYENDSLIADTTTYNEASIEVIAEKKASYTLEVLFENQAFRLAQAFYDKLGEELTDYSNLKLIYSVNKETAEAELLNVEEAQAFMNMSFEQINALLADKTPEIAPYVKMAFMPLKEVFNSKENIEAYMEDNISFILTPFNKKFILGDTISTTDTTENPFNPMQEITATTLLELRAVDESAKTATIGQTVELDLSQFKEMMKGMMQQMAQSFGANDSITAEKSKAMDDFDMDLENHQSITFDYETTWVTKVVGTSRVLTTDPRDGSSKKKEVVSTTRIK